MKLHPVDRKIPMAQSHDLALGRLGGDLETIRQGVAFHDETVIAGCFKRRGDPLKKILPVVQHRRGFPVHESVGAHDVAAEDFTDALMPETHPEEWDRRAEGADDLTANPRL